MKINRKGGGLFLTLVFLTTLAVSIFSVLRFSNQGMLLNHKTVAYQEAVFTAKSLLDSAEVQLRSHFDGNNSLPENFFSPNGGGGESLQITQAFNHNFNSNALLETELLAGEISPVKKLNRPIYSLENKYDDLAGIHAYFQRLELLSKATIHNKFTGEVSAHSRQIFEVADIPLFSYGIYYNFQLQMYPVANMNWVGPIHVNDDMYLQTSANLVFEEPVITVAGNVYCTLLNSSQQISQTISIENKNGDLVAMLDSNGTVYDSDLPDFASIAEERWNGNLKTKEMGATSKNLIGMPSYRRNHLTGEVFNPAYTIIQPVLIKDSSWDSNRELISQEHNKFAYKAGLTIKIENITNTSVNYKLFTYERDEFNHIVYDATGLPTRVEILPENSVLPFLEINRYNSNGMNVSGGIYDRRQQRGINLIELDVQKFKDAIHVASGNGIPADWGVSSSNDLLPPKDWWNGIIYVEFPYSISTSRADRVQPALHRDWGLRLKNGKIIPNPDWYDREKGTTIATNQQMYVWGSYNSDGTISNGSEFTKPEGNNYGKANSQGQEAPAALVCDLITFLSDSWDDAKSKKLTMPQNFNALITRGSDIEISAALIAGVVPIEGSPGFSGGFQNYPSILEMWDNATSGNKKTLCIRGAFVGLFQSEVAVEPVVFAANPRPGWWVPPYRKYGFHEGLAEGIFPPGTPMLRTYRTKELKLLSKSEYDAAKSKLNGY